MVKRRCAKLRFQTPWHQTLACDIRQVWIWSRDTKVYTLNRARCWWCGGLNMFFSFPSHKPPFLSSFIQFTHPNYADSISTVYLSVCFLYTRSIIHIFVLTVWGDQVWWQRESKDFGLFIYIWKISYSPLSHYEAGITLPSFTCRPYAHLYQSQLPPPPPLLHSLHKSLSQSFCLLFTFALVVQTKV